MTTMTILKTLRPAYVDEIVRNLDRGFLTGHAFDVEFNQPDGCLLHLIYKENRESEFKVLQPQSSVNPDGNWKTVESPGRAFNSAEQFTHADHNNAIHSAYGWADRIVADALAHMKAREGNVFLAAIRSKIEEFANNLPEPEVPFEKAEAEVWINNFKQMSEQLRALEEKFNVQTGIVERITAELDQLRKQAPDMPKRSWLKRAGNRIVDACQSTVDAVIKEGGKEIAKESVKALLEYMKSST